MNEREGGGSEAGDRKFWNVREKVRNHKLGDSVAWDEAQPLIAHRVESYPEKYQPHLPLIKLVFDARRRAFLSQGAKRTESYETAKRIILGLDEETEEILRPVIVFLRDLFNIEVYHRRR